VIVWDETVANPAAVRYAWAANPQGNLVNAAGLPASPFRTDEWKEITALPLAESVSISGIEVRPKKLPAGLAVRPTLGLITVKALDGRVVHRTTSRILETRATITPAGDFLLMFPEGDHYAKSKGEKMNTMIAYRSSDKGRTWEGPSVAFDIPYSQHGFIPLIPRGSKRLYAFGTQPVPGHWTWENGQQENASIGYRWSDDDGRTWSDAKLIAPVNDPGFRGMSVMRMTETDAGTWLVGSHIADWSVKPIKTKQYLLRSEDQGKTWAALPGPRPNGWFAEGFDRMDEGRPLNLGGGRVLFMTRTPQGHLFTAWSTDDGKSWTAPAPSTLVHPDAPPMLFPLSDGKTLAAFHHRKVPRRGAGDLDEKAENMKVRSEIWLATSTDEGRTWSEPRFVFANAAQPDLKVGAWNYQCSYLDGFTDDGVLHLFLPHRWQQALHLTINESALAELPTKAELAAAAAPLAAVTTAPAPASAPAAKPAPNYVGQLSAKLEPTRRVVYKKVGDRELHLDIFEPTGWKAGERRPAYVAIHGGGWTSGAPRSMYRFAAHCAELGMVGISVEYRLYKPGSEVTVLDCVKDARSALRYVRAHAAELGIDPRKIVASGASAGGHLAAATALFEVNEEGEDSADSCAPNALVLLSPVIDTSAEGYGNAKVGTRWEELSPAHRVKPGVPPTIVFHGTADTTTPFAGAQKFHEAMQAAGNRCELVSAEGAPHTYMFKDPALHATTLKQMDEFLASLGYVAGGAKR
jgi:acetyl esterase